MAKFKHKNEPGGLRYRRARTVSRPNKESERASSRVQLALDAKEHSKNNVVTKLS